MENLREKEKKILEIGQWNERMEWNCREKKWVKMEKKEGTYNQKVAKKCFLSWLPQVAFLFLKMVLASSSPQMHLSPHFLSQKVENAPMSQQLRVPRSPYFFSVQMRASFRFSCVHCFFWVLVSELPFSLNMQVSSSGLSCAPNFSQDYITASSSCIAPVHLSWRAGLFDVEEGPRNFTED